MEVQLVELSKSGYGADDVAKRTASIFSDSTTAAHAYSLNGWTDFDAQYLKRRRLVRGVFSMIEKKSIFDLDL